MKIKNERGKRGRPRLLTPKTKTTITLDVNIKKMANRLAFNRGIYLGDLISGLLKAEIDAAYMENAQKAK